MLKKFVSQRPYIPKEKTNHWVTNTKSESGSKLRGCVPYSSGIDRHGVIPARSLTCLQVVPFFPSFSVCGWVIKMVSKGVEIRDEKRFLVCHSPFVA